MSTQRFLIPSHGPNEATVKQALALTIQRSAAASEPIDVVILTHTKNALNAGNTIGDALGEQLAKQLSKGISVSLPNGKSLRHETTKTFRPTSFRGCLIACHPDEKMLNQIDALVGADSIIAIPWTMDEVAEWVRTWQPTTFGAKSQLPLRTVRNPVVEAGLKHLSDSVNLSTGLGHPLDRRKAVHLFRLLKQHREVFDPLEIRAWAVTHGWNPNDADDLSGVAKAVSTSVRKLPVSSVESEPPAVSQLGELR